MAPPRASGARGPFTIGYSNVAASATASARSRSDGQGRGNCLGASIVNPLTNLIHRNTDAAGQLSDLRTLISQNVNAIVFNPNDPDALNPVAEAHAAGSDGLR